MRKRKQQQRRAASGGSPPPAPPPVQIVSHPTVVGAPERQATLTATPSAGVVYLPGPGGMMAFSQRPA